MNIKNCTPVLFVKDAVKSRDFYAQVLGMTEIMNNGDLNFMFQEGLAIWQILPQNIIPETLGMDKITDATLPPRFEICFETEDIDVVYTALKAASVKFLHEMNTELWGQRTLRFYDPDGHLIEIGEAMHVFLQRIYEELDKDLEAVSKQTYMPVEALKQFIKL